MRWPSTIFFLLAATLAYSQQFTQRERVCCCYNASDGCCPILEFDIQLDQTLQTGDVLDHIQTPYYGNFTSAHVDENFIKTNFNVFAGEDLDCTASRLLLLPTEAGKIVPVADIPLLQISPKVCLANFTNHVESTRLREELDLVVAFAGVAGGDIEVNLAVREDIVPFTLPRHFVVASSAAESTDLDLELNIQINSNSRHNASCYLPSNLPELQFQLGSCLFPATSITELGDNILVNLDGLESGDYLRGGCYESVEVQEDFVVYTFRVQSEFGEKCIYIDEFPDNYPPFTFTVSIPSRVMTSTGQDLQTAVNLDYREESLELKPCTRDDEGFDQDVSSLIPMGRLRFEVDVLTSYDFLPIDVTLPELHIQDVELNIISGPNYLPGSTNSSAVTRFTLETAECLWVITQHSEQPATAENLVGCTVNYLSRMTVAANVTFADAFLQSNVLAGDERRVVYQSVNATDCPVQPATTDITFDYNAELTLQDTTGNSVNLNLGDPIMVRLGLDQQLMAAFDGLTVILDQIIVTLISDEQASGENNFVRLFSISEKAAQLQLDFHPYYRDGHFCRSYNETGGTCQRFYSKGSRGNWNDYMEQQLGTDFFLEDLDGGTKYAWCQDRTELQEDRFIFTPNDWIFSEFPFASGTMTITATAFVRPCDTVGDGRRRILQDGSGSTMLIQNVTFINSNVVINTGDGNVVIGESTLVLDLIIALVVLGAVLVLLVIFAFRFPRRRYER